MLTANNPQKEVNGITNYIWLIQNKTEKKIVEREQMEPSPQKNTKRIMLYLSISIIILNASDFKTSIKRQRLSDWIIKTTMCCLQEMHFKYKNTNRLKEIQTYICVYIKNTNKKPGVTILISTQSSENRILSQTKNVTSWLKRSQLIRDIIILNIWCTSYQVFKIDKAKIDITTKKNI